MKRSQSAPAYKSVAFDSSAKRLRRSLIVSYTCTLSAPTSKLNEQVIFIVNKKLSYYIM